MYAAYEERNEYSLETQLQRFNLAYLQFTKEYTKQNFSELVMRVAQAQKYFEFPSLREYFVASAKLVEQMPVDRTPNELETLLDSRSPREASTLYVLALHKSGLKKQIDGFPRRDTFTYLRKVATVHMKS
jgi:hypothetical protein